MTAHLNCVKYVCVLMCVSVIGLAGVGCKAKEAKGAGFVDKSDMSKDPSLPFQKSWIKPGFDKSKYTKVYVAPVNTEYMLKMTEWQKGINQADFERDVAKLAVFTQDKLKLAFREDPKHRMQVLDAPTTDPDALVIEMAIIEVVPSKVALNALGYAPFGIGMTINAVRMVADDTSTCAFEARIRIASTKEIVATCADREAQQLAIVTVRGLTWYSNAETIIGQWAVQFVEIANRKPGETVKETDVFTLKPW
jgi:hypothetical protein